MDASALDFSADHIVCRQCEEVLTLKAHTANDRKGRDPANGSVERALECRL
ncbi:hypothetical protein PA01_19015 [Azoarcus sp. PA01]|nr:hypothetical protein PA01_19015 [Azoarcus sp. PA01]